MQIKSILKITLTTLSVIIILGIVSAIALVTLVNPNRYKPLIIKAVNENTGRQLNLNGSISWQFYPNFGLHIEKVSLSNPAGFPQNNLFEVNSINLAIDLLPLIHHLIVINSLTINGLNLNLIKKGAFNNWTFMPVQKPAQASKLKEANSVKLQLSSLILTNSSLTYTDVNQRHHLGLTNFDFTINTTNDGAIKVDTANENIMLNRVNFNFAKIVTGHLNFTLHGFTNPNYNGEINLEPFSLNQLLNKLGIANNRLNKKLFNQFSCHTKFSGDKNNLNLSQLTFNLNKLLSGQINLKLQNFANPNYLGDITLLPFSLNNLLTQLEVAKPNLPNQTLLNKVSFQAKISGSLNNLNLNLINFKFADSSLSGNININSFSPLQLNENLALNKAELADFMPTNGFKLPIQGLTANGTLSITNLKNRNLFATLNAKQNINIQNLTLFGFNVNNFVKQVDKALTNVNNAVNGNNLQQVSNSLGLAQIVNNLKTIITQASLPGAKDLSQITNLGTLHATLLIHNGIITPASFNLIGPSMQVKGNGIIDLNRKTINYKLVTQVITKQHNHILNYIVFPYSLQGQLSNLQGSLDWINIQGQLLKYLITNNQEKIKSGINHEVKNAVENIKQGANNLIKGLFNH